MRRLLLPLLAVLLLASCTQPPSREFFQRSDGTGEYSFPIDMSDTLAAYDLSFYTAMDKPLFHRDTLSCFPLQVLWRSPSGRYFSETVYYPASQRLAPYRSGVVPAEFGEWELSVTIPGEPARLRGLGVICKRTAVQ